MSKIRARSQRDISSQLSIDLAKSFLRTDLTRSTTHRSTEFWALQDISFSLKRGEALGVMGRNGAGKSTLLRLIAEQVPPDTGKIVKIGRTEALIDLTTGFNMNASGRENIYIRGALLRRGREELTVLESEIIEFAELGDAIDAPIKTYSSGMLIRLAFAIVITSNPDLLLIDEVLAVGDFRFRQKCLARIRALRARCGFVLVSHSTSDIRAFCDRAIVLDKGKIVFVGPPEDAIYHYESELEPEGSEEPVSILEPQFQDPETVLAASHFWCDSRGTEIHSTRLGEPLFFQLDLQITRSIGSLNIGVPIWTEGGDYVTGFSTDISGDSFSITKEKLFRFTLEIPNCILNPGSYLSNISLVDGPEFLYRQANPVLEVLPDRTPHWGVVTLPHSWRREEVT